MTTIDKEIKRLANCTNKDENIHLLFPKCPDSRQPSDFVTFLLIRETQTKSDLKSFIVVMDSDPQRNRLQSEQLEIRVQNQFMLQDTLRNIPNFTMCQTSDIITKKEGKEIKYSIFSFFKQEIGLLKVRDIWVKFNSKQISINFIGMKHILLSNELVRYSNYFLMSNASFAVPMYKVRSNV